MKAGASTPPDGSAVAPVGPRPFLPALNGGVPRAFLMGTKPMVIGDIRGEHAPEMPVVEDDDMIEHIATDTPDESLTVGILPRTVRGDLDFFDITGCEFCK